MKFVCGKFLYVLNASLETIYKYIIIENISKIVPSLCKLQTINCPLLNNTLGECLEKFCEIFSGIIIGDKSLFIRSCLLMAQLLFSQNLKNKPKIHLCLWFYNFLPA